MNQTFPIPWSSYWNILSFNFLIAIVLTLIWVYITCHDISQIFHKSYFPSHCSFLTYRNICITSVFYGILYNSMKMKTMQWRWWIYIRIVRHIWCGFSSQTLSQFIFLGVCLSIWGCDICGSSITFPVLLLGWNVYHKWIYNKAIIFSCLITLYNTKN